MKNAVRLGLVLLVIGATGAWAQRPPVLTDQQIRETIVRESVAAYLSSGRPCACPYNSMRNGAACGGRSAYSKPGGASPLCYPRDVSDSMVREWKRRHGVR